MICDGKQACFIRTTKMPITVECLQQAIWDDIDMKGYDGS